jgi:putative inorganic carbon (hco3(-)) transporter
MENKLRAEQVVFVLFVFTLSFAASINLFGAPVQVSDLVFLVTAFVWFLSFVIRRETFRFDWFYFCLAAYAVVVTLSTLASVDPSRSSTKLIGKFLLIGIAFLTFNIVTSFGVLKRVMQAWLFGAGVVLVCSLIGIGLFYAGFRDAARNIVVHASYGSLPPGNYPRIEGFFAYPATLCNFLAVTLMFALAFFSNGWLRTPVFWIFTAALFIVDALTLTPGLGGIFLALGIFAKEKLKHETGRFVFVSGVLIAAAFLVVSSVTLFPYQAGQSFEASPRVHAWQTAFETFTQSPFLGRGIGMPIANAQFTDPAGNVRLLTDAHNTYVSVLGESGLLGFLTFFGIVGFAVFGLLKWKPEDAFSKTIRLCLLLALLDVVLYQSLTGSYEDARHLWVLFGIAASAKLMHNAKFTMHN